jgi:hypothetical protein
LVLAKTAGRHTEPDSDGKAPLGRCDHLPRVTRHHRDSIAALLFLTLLGWHLGRGHWSGDARRENGSGLCCKPFLGRA